MWGSRRVVRRHLGRGASASVPGRQYSSHGLEHTRVEWLSGSGLAAHGSQSKLTGSTLGSSDWPSPRFILKAVPVIGTRAATAHTSHLAKEVEGLG